MNFKEVSSFKGLESEVVVVPISLVVNGSFELFMVLFNYLVYIMRDERGIGSYKNKLKIPELIINNIYLI